MKKAVSLFLVFAMLFCLCSCGNEYSKLTDDEIAAKVDSGELGTLYAHYSVQNGDSGDFYVQFDSSLKDYDYYSDKGTLVKFYGNTAVYDQDGNKVERSDINYGQGLIIVFDGKVYGDNPVTIKAVKVSLAPDPEPVTNSQSTTAQSSSDN